MGSKQTKIEGAYLPDTPTLNRAIQLGEFEERSCSSSIRANSEEASSVDDNFDPRSPNGGRTPISVLYTRAVQQLPPIEQSTVTNSSLGVLRKRILKGFTYNLNMNDPRSPQLNRTPLMLDDLNDKTLNLNDTFADLFIESRANADVPPTELGDAEDDIQVEIEKQVDIVETEKTEETAVCTANGSNSSLDIISLVDVDETMPCPAVLEQTPTALLKQLDPRSPTIGLERTPIFFNDDDDEVAENAMLENVLATLSHDSGNASDNNSSIDSLAPGKTLPIVGACDLPLNMAAESKPTNKHLDRVRVGKKRVQSSQSMHSQRPRIYEDEENINITPKKIGAKMISQTSSARKRTPLSCVNNRTMLEVSSENTLKLSIKAPDFSRTKIEFVQFSDDA